MTNPSPFRLIIDGRVWRYMPLMRLAGGKSKTIVRTGWDGVHYTVNTPAGDPYTVEAHGGGAEIIDAADAVQVLDLYEAGREFAAVFPELNPNGTDFIAKRCVINEFPQLIFNRSPDGAWQINDDYAFKIVILEH